MDVISNHPLKELCEELMLTELNQVEPDNVEHPCKRLRLHRVEIQRSSSLFNKKATYARTNLIPSKEGRILKL